MNPPEELHPLFIHRWPKSAVLFVAFGVAGIGIGALGALAASLGLNAAQSILTLLFMFCWAVAAVSAAVVAVRALLGSYRNIEAKPWKQQIW
jgi:hypothetical protein